MEASDWETTELMILFGGGFARALGHLFRLADPDNAQRLKAAFPELWEKYQRMAQTEARLAELAAVKEG